MPYHIREPKPEDLPSLSILFDGYRQFYHYPTDVEAAQVFLQDRFNQKDAVLYVAEEQESKKLTGFVQLYPLWSSTRMSRLWLLNDLFVHPEERGKGISKLLMERCKLLARDTHACGLQLETHQDNLIGNNLYRESGFELSGENFYFWENMA